MLERHCVLRAHRGQSYTFYRVYASSRCYLSTIGIILLTHVNSKQTILYFFHLLQNLTYIYVRIYADNMLSV